MVSNKKAFGFYLEPMFNKLASYQKHVIVECVRRYRVNRTVRIHGPRIKLDHTPQYNFSLAVYSNHLWPSGKECLAISKIMSSATEMF